MAVLGQDSPSLTHSRNVRPAQRRSFRRVKTDITPDDRLNSHLRSGRSGPGTWTLQAVRLLWGQKRTSPASTVNGGNSPESVTRFFGILAVGVSPPSTPC